MIEVGEYWKDIKGYEGLYKVSNLGRVRRMVYSNGKYKFERIRECKQTLNTYGYMTVNLCKNGKAKTKRVHRLVAETFIPNPNNLPQVDHIDGNKQNNNINNLEYVTARENTKRAWKNGLAKKTENQINISRKIMLERWKNNKHRSVRGIKRTKEEKREYMRNYQREHKRQYSQNSYKVEE